MTKRLEFPGKIRDQAFARANGQCEKCGMPFGSKRPEYDHRLPDALGGKPELSNCWVLCTPCHKEKTASEDVPRIRKADRQRKAANGSKAQPARKLQSRGFDKTEPQPKAGRARIDKSIFGNLENQSHVAQMFRASKETRE